MKKSYIAIMLLLVAPLAFATGSKGNSNGPSNTNSEASAIALGLGVGVGQGGNAAAQGGDAAALGVGTGGDSSSASSIKNAGNSSSASGVKDSGNSLSLSSSEGGKSSSASGVKDSGNSLSLSEGGDASATVKGSGNSSNSNGAYANQSQTNAGNTVEGGDVLVQGDSINYEVAANKATLIASGCQVGGSADGIKFGISVIKQSPACLLLQTSTDALMFAAAMNCGDFAQSVTKGSDKPDTSACLRTRSQLVQNALNERAEAVEYLRRDAKQGFAKKVWRFIW